MFVILKDYGEGLWTVGHYGPGGDWHPLKDYDDEQTAMRICGYLNGGSAELYNQTKPPQSSDRRAGDARPGKGGEKR